MSNFTGNGALVRNSIIFGGGGSAELSGLEDVTITSPTSGQYLKYDGSEWVNGAGGGGESIIYLTKAQYEATTPVADQLYCITDWDTSVPLTQTWTGTVSALTGATTATITDSAIHTTSVIEPFADNGTGTMLPPPTITVTEGQCVLTFDALASDTTFRLRVTNL